MKAEKVAENKQKKLHEGKRKEDRREDENLSFYDFEELMRHRRYKRCKGGAIRQVDTP